MASTHESLVSRDARFPLADALQGVSTFERCIANPGLVKLAPPFVDDG